MTGRSGRARTEPVDASALDLEQAVLTARRALPQVAMCRHGAGRCCAHGRTASNAAAAASTL